MLKAVNAYLEKRKEEVSSEHLDHERSGATEASIAAAIQNPPPEWNSTVSHRMVFPQFWKSIAELTLCHYSQRRSAKELVRVRARRA
jgi:hypothetical protein